MSVTPLCIGTSPLGSMPNLYGYDVETGRAVATMLRAFEGPMNFVDTSNGYGEGASERRIGAALRERGGLPDGFVLATKVDPDPETGDFSGKRVRVSVEESLERLGVDHLQLLHLHDPERISFGEAMAPRGAVEALIALRDEGVVDHLGVAGGPIDELRRYVGTGAFEVVLTHNRYTLLDRSAGPLLDDAAARGIAVLNGAPYAGGMLVKGPKAQPKYGYRPGGSDILSRVAGMERACKAHEVPLAAAALQFSMRESRIASTVVGISAPERVEQTLALAEWPIPEVLWTELEWLLPPAESWWG
ncbi:MAG: aldo/keto reductase [Actinopolymorphaceae bacterium]